MHVSSAHINYFLMRRVLEENISCLDATQARNLPVPGEMFTYT